MLIVFGIFALFLMSVGAWRIVIRSRCRVEVPGIFVRWDRISTSKGGSMYAPVFRYRIRAGECEWRASDSFAEGACPDFVAGQVYSIWVDPNHEKRFVVRKGVGA